MAEGDNPEGTVEAASEQDNYDALADLLDDPEEDNEGQEAEAEDADEGETEDEDSEDSDEDAEDEGEDGSAETGSKIVGYDARVRGPDGKLTTVGTLVEQARGDEQSTLRQSDYTRKAMALSERQKSYDQAFQTLNEQLETVDAAIKSMKPQRPDVSPQEDVMAHIAYQDAMDRWNEWQTWLASEREKAAGGQQGVQKTERDGYLRTEHEALLSALPTLRDPKRFDAFFDEATKLVAEFGYSADDLKQTADHRVYRLLDALMKAKKNRAEQVKDNVKRKPKMVKGKRSDPSAHASKAKTANLERLRNEGTMDAGVRALMDLDL